MVSPAGWLDFTVAQCSKMVTWKLPVRLRPGSPTASCSLVRASHSSTPTPRFKEGGQIPAPGGRSCKVTQAKGHAGREATAATLPRDPIVPVPFRNRIGACTVYPGVRALESDGDWPTAGE